jgi:uncharacterized protein (DUF362 family)
VAVVRGRDLKSMVEEALEAIGGIGAVVHEGEKVFIKPNFGGVGLVSHDTVLAGDSTKPEIVVAVAEECLKAGAAEVAIGEGAQVPVFSWEGVQTIDGASNMASEAERLSESYGRPVSLVCLTGNSPAWVAVPSPYTGLNEIHVSSLLVNADRVISIPVLKTHRWTQVTGSMKNLVGVTSADNYGYGFNRRSKLHDSPGGIEQCFLDIVAAIRPDLAIIDASNCCEGNGPHILEGWWGSTVDMKERLGDWLLVASTDLAAADATAARIIGQDVSRVSHLLKANEQGLGQTREDLIQVVGSSIDSVRVDFRPAESTDGFWDILLPGIMLTTSG